MLSEHRSPLTLACAAFAMIALAATSASAVVVPIVDVYGHNERTNFAGRINDMIIGSGMNGHTYAGGDPNDPGFAWPTSDPSTWTATSNQYQNEWQSQGILNKTSSINGKIGWTVFDLGSAVPNLDEFYIWNVRENNARAVNQYNVYYATTPIGLAHGPTSGSANLDYNFGSAGWTLLNGGGPLSMTWRNTAGANPNAILDLGGITARYLAVEILSNGVGTTGDATRTGLAEVGITAQPPATVPEPATAALGLIGMAGLMVRRRRMA